MNFSKLTLLSALALATLTYCGSSEEKKTSEAMDEHGMNHDHDIQTDDMMQNKPDTELGRIQEMSREDYVSYAKMSDVAQIEASAEAKQQISSITKSYLSLKDALVEGNTGKAADAAKNMNKQLSGFSSTSLEEELQDIYSSRADKLMQDAQAIASATDVAEQRAYLVSLSRNIAELNQAFNTEETLYLQYCPMAFDGKGGYWVSAEEKVMNPYYGDAMLTCGRVDKQL